MEGTQEIDATEVSHEEPQAAYLVGEMARLIVKPGDKLVVKLKKKLDHKEQVELWKMFSEWVGPEVKVMILDPWISIGVVTSDERAE